MRDVTLEALELSLDDDDVAGMRDDCIPIVQRITRGKHSIIGLVPASNQVGVAAIGVQLGLAMCQLSGGTVAYVDANVRWPAIRQTALGQERSDDDESAFTTRWLRGSLALLTPPRASDAGAGLPELARVIQQSSNLFAQVLIDLTGFKQLGEHLAAIEMTDALIVVARAGLTREDELLRLRHELPAHLNLGVLLTAAAPPIARRPYRR
jgi:hypothetical protein